MQKKLTITIDEDVYAALHRVVGRRKISGFIESLVRLHVIGEDCDSAHRENVSAAGVDMTSGPSLVTESAHTAHVRTTIEDLVGQEESMVELLAMPEAANIDFDPLRLDSELYRESELS
jgi:hypothetical protein